MDTYDLIIIGTGAGGGTLAYALADSGMRILLIERGDYLPQEPQNWQPRVVFDERRYKPHETWYGQDGKPFHPGVHYFVGGNTKVYGAALPRLRREDFGALEHEGGTSPAWPISYDELEPYYNKAETIYRVHGVSGEDLTEPPRSCPFPFPAVEHEPAIGELASRLRANGLHPFHLPMGVDVRAGGACILCKTCDGFPCQLLAKSEADVCCVRPALASPTVTLWTRTKALRLLTDSSGKADHRRRSRERRRQADSNRRTLRSFLRRRQLGTAAAALGEQRAPQRDRQRQRAGWPQLHGA